MKIRISCILLGLSLSFNFAYAAHSNETPLPTSKDINVTVPNQPGIWSFGLMAVWMQPVNKGYNYASEAIEIPNLTASAGETDKSFVLNETYYGWFGADIAYAFPNNGRDISLAYEGLHGNTTDSASDNFNNDVNSLFPRDFLFGNVTGNEVTYIEAKTETRYDAGDLLLGQKMAVGRRVFLHPFMGLRYAHIDVEDSFKSILEAFPLEGSTGGTEQGEIETSFNGIGPRLGSDAAILLGKGFGIHARLGVSALIGTQKYNINYTETFLRDTVPTSYTNVQSQDREPETHVIPEVDIRLGLNYTHPCTATMTLGVEVGWQVTDYFQALANASLFFSEAPLTVRTTNMDFALQGPYARIQLDVA